MARKKPEKKEGTYYERNKEKIKARIKAYRDKNKEAYNEYQAEYQRKKRAAETPEEREKRLAEMREDSKIWYENNKEKKQAQQKEWNEANKDHLRAYQRDWEAGHRDQRNEAQREQYQKEKVVDAQLRENSELLTTAQAAAMLNISRRTLEARIQAGQIDFTKSTTGRNYFRREDILALTKTNQKGTGIKIVKMAGTNEVPDGFDLITEYEELTEYTLAFAAKKIGFLLLVGSPGSGKSRQMKSDLAGKPCTWIDNHVTNMGLYINVYEADHRPVVLDDVNHFLKNKLAVSLIKALTQTEKERGVSWESPLASVLDQRNIPRSYTTSSPICLIANMWDSSNADFAAIQDRSLPVAFFPSAETIHKRVVELGWCPTEIVDFVGDNLADIPQPSMREYYLGMTYKKAGMDWQAKLHSLWDKPIPD